MKDKIIESFKQYLKRRVLRERARGNVITWDAQNRGNGIPAWDGKNQQKRLRREAWKLDRLAQLRVTQGSTNHAPRLKRIPASVHE